MPDTQELRFYVRGQVAEIERKKSKNGKSDLAFVSLLQRTGRGLSMLSAVTMSDRVPEGIGEGDMVIGEVTVSVREGRLSCWLDKCQPYESGERNGVVPADALASA